MTRKQEGLRQIQKPRQGQVQKCTETSAGRTKDLSLPFLQQASFHHTRSKMSSQSKVKMFTFCPYSTDAKYYIVQR